MKTTFTSILAFVIYLATYGQNVKLKESPSHFYCVSDSIKTLTIRELASKGVDSIITLSYDFDNGRYETAETLILWTENGKELIRKYRGCDNIQDDSTYNLNIAPLFDFFVKERIDTLSGQLVTENWQSHDFGYYVTVYLPGIQKQFNVREYQKLDGILKKDQNPKGKIDSRIEFILFFEELTN